MAVRLSALWAGRPLPFQEDSWVLISVRGWVDPRAIVRLEELGKLKKIHLVGTRTRHLPACIIVPQPTTLPLSPPIHLTNIVRASHETRHVSATKLNRLMLFGEIITVYCENHTEHTNTLCGQNAEYINSVRTSQETHYVSTTKPNRLMLFRK
jgi:hypothetical protein